MRLPRSGFALGISLVEVLVAMSIGLIVTTLACILAVRAQQSWEADSGRLDLHQRGRVAADLLTRVLRDAGLGAPTAGGPLIHAFAPVLPRRTGARGAHPPGAFRADAFSLIRAVGEAEGAVLLSPAPPAAAVLDLSPSPSCRALPCGLADGVHVAVFDTAGQHDLFTIVRVEGSTAVVRHHGEGNAASYPSGSPVLPVESASYYLDAPTRTLRVYDGDRSDFPVVDDVVSMHVEYYGEARPPALPKPRAGVANCLYGADGVYHGALMPTLPAPAGAAVLSPEVLTDGPWCGNGNTRFDADLLRVRRVRVRVRLQASNPALRGASGALFAQPGFSKGDGVPDAMVVVDVFPPNLAFGANGSPARD